MINIIKKGKEKKVMNFSCYECGTIWETNHYLIRRNVTRNIGQYHIGLDVIIRKCPICQKVHMTHPMDESIEIIFK